MHNDCIFCKIINDEIPATKIYEDKLTLAFMDIGPVSKGHVLVVPKEHHDPLMNTPDKILHALVSVAKKIAQAQKKGLKADGINLTQANGEVAGQIIPHIHFHIIPRYKNSDSAQNWHPGKYESQKEKEQYAEKIRSAL